MYQWETTQAVTAQRVFGIIRTAGPKQAVAAAEAVLNAGLHAVEIALTTPRALTALARLAETHPDALLGAGTVIDTAAARAAVEAGARFLVSPSLHPEVIRTGHRYGVPVFPGVATPTDMVRALEEGADALKLFPASAVSPSWLRDVRAALPQAPVLPTGGVTIDNAPEWIAAGAVACGMGSALTSGGARSAGERVSTLLRTLAEAR
ncbi:MULTISPECIES: bifunctional 4-hydroxy-2-oxoglutarate aldolase/2-dehydro-3-deoxy-phosphogluconate aldolase [unclassified Streptomyces]|uniref:bifunctional 4-hydroxy-2-oxoglutarate aldolase/2-dehydro-3-deoxy-phosphogluconate aldolase n=1 Tax=unclassified Streptomyces TaxID=2593676 RepID=UPI002255EFB5|nr:MULTISPECIES: bifunctional 4-hydroxy-2-oxoglutarate aldolase/2-dehydro-3-deoxy-phosphogluconate aldolase [unclassified Streptomyces]WSP59767.1 bifunctional 4-hydroxy-2-oxoglutarate aldolase/2-dehydro-3-deoxy-phosphogluconate aldolase [Streptomyces sp. NBC_01241]WSU19717.1 bifunctional 4-hydroxy-2-oxoglutarate aldolase/2-dehydro-3-deoxy-phosphogluconate aldolase [Streptomyces sp. NBC_01108]MCX4791654.1 bifunctional 4-hydroxy-2-oxoglutarate aldolase/2-dehydro-3-deoxy-phosphogluconate aldolase [